MHAFRGRWGQIILHATIAIAFGVGFLKARGEGGEMAGALGYGSGNALFFGALGYGILYLARRKPKAPHLL